MARSYRMRAADYGFIDCPNCNEGDDRNLGLNVCGNCECRFVVNSYSTKAIWSRIEGVLTRHDKSKLPSSDAREALADHQIKYMVDRFLSWKLPENFNPDGGVSFERFGNKDTPHQYRRDPSGTNLIDATQAEVMVRHMIEGMPSAALRQPAAPGGEPVAWLVEFQDGGAAAFLNRSTVNEWMNIHPEQIKTIEPLGKLGALPSHPSSDERAKVVEECARIADEVAEGAATPNGQSRAKLIAERIRALSLSTNAVASCNCGTMCQDLGAAGGCSYIKADAAATKAIDNRCPKCGDLPTHQTPDGTYWDGNAHFWRLDAAATEKGR